MGPVSVLDAWKQQGMYCQEDMDGITVLPPDPGSGAGATVFLSFLLTGSIIGCFVCYQRKQKALEAGGRYRTVNAGEPGADVEMA
jgi:hypothetical protein